MVRRSGAARLGAGLLVLIAVVSGLACRREAPDRQGRSARSEPPAVAPVATIATRGAGGDAAPTEPTPRPLPRVSGEIYLRERIAMPSGTRVNVRVVRMEGGRAGRVVAALDFEAPRHMPFPFELACDPDEVGDGGSFGLEAEVVRRGQTLFATSAPVQVLSGGLPTTGVKLLLRRAG